MLKRIIWTCAVIALIAWFIQNKVESYNIRDNELADNQRVLNKIKASLTNLELETGASSNWETSLGKGERYSSKTILTIELENLWIKNSPIIYIGSIHDIVTLDESHYKVEFERNLNGTTLFETELKLSLKAEKKIIDKFLSENPNIMGDYGFNNSVAVSAQILEIESSQISGEDGYITEVKTGSGKLLGIVFTDRLHF